MTTPESTDLHILNSSMHTPAWVRVNTQVDQGIAEVVSLLSQIDQLETVESCEGYPDAPAFVYFRYGDWKNLCWFLFESLGPEIHKHARARASVEVFNGSDPLGKISFANDAIPAVVSVLKWFVQARERAA